FPVLAVLLAATARWQIRTSEGARSGLALATWGLRLGLFFGITHAAIFFGTLLAVWMQAQTSLDKEFVAKIQEGNLDDAFQFTLPSKDSKESRKRRWHVIWKDEATHIVRREFTPLGEKMQFWQAAARDFAYQWVMARSQGRVSEAFLATCPPQDRDSQRRQY